MRRIPRDLDLTITDLTDAAGFWTATVTAGGVSVFVTRAFGSWMQRRSTVADDVGELHHFRDVLPHIAATLQARVIFIERKRRLAAGTDTT